MRGLAQNFFGKEWGSVRKEWGFFSLEGKETGFLLALEYMSAVKYR